MTGTGGSGPFRLVRVAAVDVALPDQYPTVVLHDAEGPGARRLTFRVGMAEGVALAHALRGTTPPRPLTVDLLAEGLRCFGVEVVAVRLVGRRGATYLALVELRGPAGGREVLDCRPSDGLALALLHRPPAPVLADERLFATDGDVDLPVPGAPVPGARDGDEPSAGPGAAAEPPVRAV